MRFEYSASERVSNAVIKKYIGKGKQAARLIKTLQREVSRCKVLNHKIFADLMKAEQAQVEAEAKLASHERMNIDLVNANVELREQVAKLEFAELRRMPIPRKPGYSGRKELFA